LTDVATGEGVFKAQSGWVICGSVKNGIFANGRRVSANAFTKELRLDFISRSADGTVLQKIEQFSLKGVQTGFYMNG